MTKFFASCYIFPMNHLKLNPPIEVRHFCLCRVQNLNLSSFRVSRLVKLSSKFARNRPYSIHSKRQWMSSPDHQLVSSLLQGCYLTVDPATPASQNGIMVVYLYFFLMFGSGSSFLLFCNERRFNACILLLINSRAV